MPGRQRATDGLNAALVALVAVPPLCSQYLAQHYCAVADGQPELLQSLCTLYLEQPLAAVNLLFAVHVDLTFYLISLAQVRQGN